MFCYYLLITVSLFPSPIFSFPHNLFSFFSSLTSFSLSLTHSQLVDLAHSELADPTHYHRCLSHQPIRPPFCFRPLSLLRPSLSPPSSTLRLPPLTRDGNYGLTHGYSARPDPIKNRVGFGFFLKKKKKKKTRNCFGSGPCFL